jgi:hypothetical protein
MWETTTYFFVGSIHTVRAGSEVNRIIFEVLPRLGEGTWIHFHNIHFPYDYQRRILSDTLFFWGESALLHAFLINNPKFVAFLSQSLMHYKAPEALAKVIERYDPQENIDGLEGVRGKHFPSSIYLRTIN